MREGVRSAVAAITFLTAVPIGRRHRVSERDLRGGAVLFPVVGGLVGGLVALVAWAAAFVVQPLVAATVGTAWGVLLTAALHVDGLADTADGMGAALAGRDPTTVMRDPRLGTFGGAALILDLLLKVSVLGALVAGPRFPFEVIAAGALGRVAPLALSAALPYVGPPDGIGVWTRARGLGSTIGGVVIAAAIGVTSVGWRVGAMVLAGVLVTFVIGRWAAVHLGGTTGDALGAAVELTETVALTTALATR